jgi:hypothetical protein
MYTVSLELLGVRSDETFHSTGGSTFLVTLSLFLAGWTAITTINPANAAITNIARNTGNGIAPRLCI